MTTAAAQAKERQTRRKIPIRLSSRRERSDQYHRDQFVGQFVATMEARKIVNVLTDEPTHVVIERAAAILAAAKGFHRLQEQQCNGDGYYAPPRTHSHQVMKDAYTTCPVCEDEVPVGAMVGSGRYVLGAFPKLGPTYDRNRLRVRQCVDCRQRERIRQLLPEGWRVRFQGDPRGCTVKIAYAPDARWIWESDMDRWTTAQGAIGAAMLGPEPRWLGVW